MKLKIAIITLLSAVMILSVVEIFPVMPASANWYPWYKSEYFSEIDRQYKSISESFRLMLIYSKPEYAFMFLDELSNTTGVVVKVYDSNGDLLNSPGEIERGSDENVLRLTRSANPAAFSVLRGSKYYQALPLPFDKRFRVLQGSRDGQKGAAIMTFERGVDGKLYFSAERRIIFSLIALACGLLIFLVYRWDPDRHLKKLLNK